MSKALRDRPDVDFWMPEYITAFELLSGRRSYGMGANPISLEAIVAYVSIFDASDVYEFVTLICQMDVVYLTKTSEKLSKSEDKKAKKNE